MEENALNLPVRILIVDDHPNTAEMLARVLSRFDHPVDVLTAQSGEEALEIVQENRVDILITDFLMAGMSGLDLVERLNGDREPTHKILITAYDAPGLARAARQLHVQDYLIKPVQPDKIREIVSHVIQQIRPTTNAIIEMDKRQTYKILIADDYPDNIRLLTARLKSEGYSYLVAKDGEEALEKIRTEKPDLALLDVNMPKKNGFEVVAEVRKDARISSTSIIIITAARISEMDIQEGLILGADDYITKPVDWRELSARIRNKLRVKHEADVLRKRNEELQIFSELSSDIGSNFDLEMLTKMLLGHIVDTVKATNGCMIVFHPDGRTTQQLHTLTGLSLWHWEDPNNQYIPKSLVEEVVTQREPIVIPDTTQDVHWAGTSHASVRSVFAIPLTGRTGVIGMLALTHDQTNYFQLGHLELVKAACIQSALAIENAHLYSAEQKLVRDIASLNNLLRGITSFSSQEELHEALPNAICQHLAYPAAAIWGLEGGQLLLKSIHGAENAVHSPLLEIGPRQAVSMRQPIHFSGALSDKGGKKGGAEGVVVQSVIAVPVMWSGRINAILSIHSRRFHAFQESDLAFLEILATLVASQLERLRVQFTQPV